MSIPASVLNCMCITDGYIGTTHIAKCPDYQGALIFQVSKINDKASFATINKSCCCCCCYFMAKQITERQ